MSELIPYQSIYINSTPGITGISGTGSNFSVYLQGSPIIPRNGRLVRAAVTTATIPLTFTGVNSGNNVVNISESAPTPATFNVTLLPGQYSSASFAAMVTSQFNIASSASGNGITYTITLSTDTGRITFDQPVGEGNATTINLDSPSTTAFIPLGLPTYANNGSVDPEFAGGFPYTAPNVINIFGPSEFHIRCGNFLANIYETRVQSEAPILAIVPIVGNQFESVIYIPAVPKLYGTIGSRLDRLDFLITDENGIIVDLQNYGVKIQLALYDVPL